MCLNRMNEQNTKRCVQRGNRIDEKKADHTGSYSLPSTHICVKNFTQNIFVLGGGP